jgi:tetratricopeptide (TPR) repeat protein
MKISDYNLTDNDINHFDDLYSRKLTEEEYYILIAKLELDEVYRHKYKLYSSFLKEVNYDAYSSKILKERFERVKYKTSRRKKIFRFYISFAVICFFFTFLFYLNFINISDSELYNYYKDVEIGIPIKMGVKEASAMDSLMILVATNKYNKAINLLSNMPKTDTSEYFKGICYERLNKLDEALIIYNTNLNSKDKILKDKSNFRIGLIYLKLNDKRSEIVFSNIAKDSLNDYQGHAINIINQSKFKLFP